MRELVNYSIEQHVEFRKVGNGESGADTTTRFENPDPDLDPKIYQGIIKCF